MTDRELLEKAAKAAGINARMSDDGLRLIERGVFTFPWNPLTDDGDALRLAVKLKIDLRIDDGMTEAIWINEPLSESDSHHEPHDPDPYAATRRAIVRAAASMEVDK